MKIAFITEYRGMGGGEINLLRLIKKLTESHEIGLLCASGKLIDSARNQHNPKLTVYEINPVRNMWRKDFPVPLYFPRLIRFLNKFDIVHSYSVNPLPMLIWCKKPIVWTVHGPWERPFGRRAWFIKYIVKKALPVSSDVKNILQMSNNKVEQVNLGAIFAKDIYPSYQPFDGKNLELCCIGSYQFIKGQDVLLDALILMARIMPNLQIRLWLVGDINSEHITSINYKSSLLSKIESIKIHNLKIMVEGFQNDVESYIKKSHLIIVPSRYESFSMVTVESLAKGKQVIGPNIGGPKEILNVPKTGYHFLPDDPNSLCETIILAVKNYPKECPPETLERASHFTIEGQTLMLESIYRSILKMPHILGKSYG